MSTKNVLWGIIWRLGPVTTGHLLLVKSHACVLPEGGGGGVGGLGRVGKSDRGSRHRLTRPGQTNVLHSDRWTQTETRLETAGQRCAATRQQLQTCGATTQFMDLKYMGRDLAPKYFPPKVVTWLSWVYLGQNYPPPCQPSQRESLGHVPALLPASPQFSESDYFGNNSTVRRALAEHKIKGWQIKQQTRNILKHSQFISYWVRKGSSITSANFGPPLVN